jgi:hypothetical protein
MPNQTELGAFHMIEDAIVQLRFHYGLQMGGRRFFEAPPKKEFHEVAGVALGHEETTITEGVASLLTMTVFDARKLVDSTPTVNLPRLRLAVSVANLLLDVSSWGLPDSITMRQQLNRVLNDVRVRTAQFSSDDQWNNIARLHRVPAEYWTAFFLPMGLMIRWPLADFFKTWAHAKAGRLGVSEAP